MCKALQKCKVSFARECQMSATVLHLVVSNKPHPGLDVLLASSSRISNLQTRVLGLGSQTPIGHGFKGFGLKLELLKQELLLCPPLQPVLFTDAWDVVLQGSIDPLLQWLDAHPGKVLFSAETAKWPDKNLFYPIPLQFPFPYLNSGCFCGRAQDLLKLLQKPFTSKTDDQGYYSEQFVDPANTIIELDHKADMFLSMFGLDANDLQMHKEGVTFRGKSPIVLHLNNGATRIKWFVSVVRAVLGEPFVPPARSIAIKTALSAVDSWPWKWILLTLFLVWMVRRVLQGIQKTYAVP